MILMLDNYDSFTYNLVQELAEVAEVVIEVVRNDVRSVDELLALEPQAAVISPGPGVPEEAGVSMELVRAAGDLPLLGICLGHQALAAVRGGRVVRAAQPVHGKTSLVGRPGTTHWWWIEPACRRASSSRHGRPTKQSWPSAIVSGPTSESSSTRSLTCAPKEDGSWRTSSPSQAYRCVPSGKETTVTSYEF